MSEIAIAVRDVSVSFRPFVDKSPTLRRRVGAGEGRAGARVQALDHVSFDIRRGEAFGIVGRNGAGKSTLLRLLARTMRPNQGAVEVFGRTSTLLQLGVGMNSQLSGRRNIYLGSLAAGAKKAEVDSNFDSIVAYAELGEAIDRPVKTYSSGMFARLAFSVSMHMDPDILLLDEVLAVGDEGFRNKSMKTMQSLLDRSGTIVLVSHSLKQVEDFCDRALWLDRGAIQAIGAAEDVVASYRSAVGSTDSQ